MMKELTGLNGQKLLREYALKRHRYLANNERRNYICFVLQIQAKKNPLTGQEGRIILIPPILFLTHSCHYPASAMTAIAISITRA